MTDKEMLQAMSDVMDEKFQQYMVNIAPKEGMPVKEYGEKESGFVTKPHDEQVSGGSINRVAERIKRMGEEMDAQYEELIRDVRGLREEMEKWEKDKRNSCCCRRRYLAQQEILD